MRKQESVPSLRHDLAALADLYLTFLWMLRQRLHYGSAWQYRCHRPANEAEEEVRREKTKAA